MIPGEYFLDGAPGEIELSAGRERIRVEVRHTGDRPIQIGSHFHFYEVNRALDFEREKARGFRLDLPAGLSVRFEPGETKEVALTRFGGEQILFGHRGLVNGPLEAAKR